MSNLERIQVISRVLRYLVIAIASGILVAVIIGQLIFGQWWISLGDDNFNVLWENQEVSRVLLAAVMAPLLVIMLMGVYWLQRLLSEFQKGYFFTESNMRCFLWLLWLKVASFVYAILWPLVLSLFLSQEQSADMEILLNIGDFFDLLLLVVILHLLKAAQSINRENKEFV